MNIADIAREVAKNLAGDNVVKQRILQSAPHLYALDVGQLEQMSSEELARKELEGYGVKVSSAPTAVEVRDAFHGGRMFEYGRRLGGGGRPAAMDGASTHPMKATLDAYLNPKPKE